MSKLSLHISSWLDPDTTFDWIEKTQPALLKVLGDGGLDDFKLREARRRSPHTLVVGRKYFTDQLLEHIDDTYPGDSIANYDPAADAQNVYQQMAQVLGKFRGLVDVWEGLNEVPIDVDAPLTPRNHLKARAYNRFTVALASLIHGAGYKYAAYSFSTGNPVHVELWDDLVDGVRASDYIALHEYIAPDVSWQHFDLGMCNRYRAVYARLPADARRPVLVTECGDDYFGQQGYTGMISDELYLSHLKAYDSQLMQDPYAVGATVYCYGISGPQWKSYDIGGDFARMLADYIASTPTPVSPMPVPPAAPPQPPAQPPHAGPAVTFEQARWWTEEATRRLEAGDSLGARAALVETVIPWFYAWPPPASPRDAQAADQARWFTEEAVRRIESGDASGAHYLLKQQVIPWFYSV